MQHKNDSVLEAKKAKVKLPPMYKVLLLNDDYTPMEFVVLVLQKFFGMTRERPRGANRRRVPGHPRHRQR